MHYNIIIQNHSNASHTTNPLHLLHTLSPMLTVPNFTADIKTLCQKVFKCSIQIPLMNKKILLCLVNDSMDYWKPCSFKNQNFQILQKSVSHSMASFRDLTYFLHSDLFVLGKWSFLCRPAVQETVNSPLVQP